MIRTRRAQSPRKLQSCRRLDPILTDPRVATNPLAQAERLWTSLLGLGVRRLMALALIGVAVFAATGFAGYYLSRPSTETLYSGLDRDDVVSIGSSAARGRDRFRRQRRRRDS